MQRRFVRLAAFVALVLTVLPTMPALAIDEPERLWLVGERAFADGLYPVARRALEQFVDRYATDARAAHAFLMLGKSRLILGDIEPALEAFRRGARANPEPTIAFETRFWEAETLFRLKRYAEARTAYDEVFRHDAGAALAPDALYGFGWTELELKRPESAVTVFRDFLKAWGDHPLAPSATYQMARALLDLKRSAEAVPLLTGFATKYPKHPRVADAQFLLGAARIAAGDTRHGLTDLAAFVDAHPNHPQVPEARRLRREALAKGGNARELQEVYASLMSQSPSTVEALDDALKIARRLKRPRDEDAAWRKLRADFPAHPATQKLALEYATAAYKRNQWKETVAYADALTTSSDDVTRAEGWLLIGESELKLKRFPAAAKAFEEVSDIEGADPGARYRALAGLGLAREEMKEWRAALTAYEAVASKSPDTALKKWARDRAAVVKARLNGPPAPKTPAPKTPAAKPKGKS